MSEHGGPAGADGFDGGRGHETHGIPRAMDARNTPAAIDAIEVIHAIDVTATAEVGWRQRHEAGVLRGPGGGMGRTALTMASSAAKRTPAPRPLEPPEVPCEHLGKDVLWRFMTGGLSPAEMRQVFGHLLRGCASCREQAREVWNITDPPATSPRRAMVDARAVAAPPPVGESTAPDHADAANAGGAQEMAYETVLDRVFSRIASEEAGIEAARRRADVLFEELMQHPPARQELLVHNSARFRDRMLCERLLAASHDEGFREPARSEQLARIAVAVAERVADICAEAARLLDRVITIYQRLGQSNLTGRALSQKAMLQFHTGDREGCMVLLRRA